jgi:hypothetical protein
MPEASIGSALFKKVFACAYCEKYYRSADHLSKYALSRPSWPALHREEHGGYPYLASLDRIWASTHMRPAEW